jgi:hypothetical protein
MEVRKRRRLAVEDRRVLPLDMLESVLTKVRSYRQSVPNVVPFVLVLLVVTGDSVLGEVEGPRRLMCASGPPLCFRPG